MLFRSQNPLKSAKRRYPWHACPCCVGNIPRTLFALKDRMWSRSPDGKTLYLDQFIASEGDFDGIHFNLETKYPDSGRVKLTLSSTNAKNGKPFTLAIRFPNRMESALYKAVPEVKGGYVKRTVKLSYGAPEVMEFEMPMPLQKVTAMPEVKDHAGLVAYQRGPIVYSIEDGKKVPNYDRLNGDFTGESSVWISDSSNSSNEEEAK